MLRQLQCAAAAGLLMAGYAAGQSLTIAPPTYDHIVIVIEENESLNNVIGSANAPYINQLANSGVQFNNFYAITHPSQPNYLQLFSGAQQGVFDDNVPASHFTTANLGAALLAGGKTFAGYSETQPGIGSDVATSTLTSGQNQYVRKHNPWTNWQGSGTNQLPTSVNRPFFPISGGADQTGLPFYGDLGTPPSPPDFSTLNFAALPNVTFVVPNEQHDMHDGTIKMADDWLKANLSAYADWAKTHNSLLVVTFDEDDSQTGATNKIPTLFYGANLKNGAINSTAYTLHNLLRTIEDVNGVSHSGAAGYVNPIYGVFTGQQTPNVVSFRQGVSGYSSAHDTYIEQDNASTTHASALTLTVDKQVTNGPAQALIRFDNIIGNGAGQVPLGATVLTAKLMVKTGGGTNDKTQGLADIHRMLVSWDEATATWSSTGSGIATDGSEASASYDFMAMGDRLSLPVSFDVTASVQAWANGAANYGWLITPETTDGWVFNSSDAATSTDRPYLEVTYVVPEPGMMSVVVLAAPMLLGRRRKF